ncbi:MAG: HprK-related kinase B [Thiomicrorhabdus chilensis]|uniref:HprK-related kinase B n=1 Tax=Thiomicrorhabdus chilensis TaxID=63656 RepID=UPI00299E8DF0|nr:HprK-related kinase B [Thiomicrorhabdus chilensis]MDX1347710.1 HprK-related kinase B [Thiomicrorhabdus chilensis]
MSTHPNAQNLLDYLLNTSKQVQLQPKGLSLDLKGFPLEVRSNSQALLETLRHYFAGLSEWSSTSNLSQAQAIFVYQSDVLQNAIQQTEWQDWRREPGKTGRKDAVADVRLDEHPVRLLHKVKTGMLFVQPAPFTEAVSPMAFGPAETHSSQIINFVLTQYLNHHLRHQWLLGHASALQIHNHGLAIAGLSGGGKSTLMLHLLEEGQHFISNDRLLMKQQDDGSLTMRGIPKQPRINPGTIVHNPRLQGLISTAERERFLAMPSESLRALEQKYDAPVDQLYHPDCYQAEAQLDALFILNWQAQSELNTHVTLVDIGQRSDLLPAIMKTPGPFYARDEHGFLANGFEPEPQEYQTLLQHCRVYEITGNIDFEDAKQQILELLERF